MSKTCKLIQRMRPPNTRVHFDLEGLLPSLPATAERGQKKHTPVADETLGSLNNSPEKTDTRQTKPPACDLRVLTAVFLPSTL